MTSGGLCDQEIVSTDRETGREGLLSTPWRERLKRIRCFGEAYSRAVIELPEQLITKENCASQGILCTFRELREDLSVHFELMMEVVGTFILTKIQIDWVGIDFLLGKGSKEAWLWWLGIATVVGDSQWVPLDRKLIMVKRVQKRRGQSVDGAEYFIETTNPLSAIKHRFLWWHMGGWG